MVLIDAISGSTTPVGDGGVKQTWAEFLVKFNPNRYALGEPVGEVAKPFDPAPVAEVLDSAETEVIEDVTPADEPKKKGRRPKTV